MRKSRVNITFIICIFYFLSFSALKAQKVISLNPLFNEQNAILIPEIEGYWKFPVFDWTMSLKKTGDNFYQFIDGVESLASEYEAVFIKIEDEIFLDLAGKLPENIGDSDFRDNFLSGHTIYKIKIVNNALIISLLEYSWFFTQAVKKKSPLKFEWIKNGILLTFSTDEFKSFLVENFKKDGIFSNPDTLIIENDFFETVKDTLYNKSTSISPISLSQNCFPEFPFKDGWLGGDGDVSVPINDTTIVFIFSDTYIGNKNQISRKESDMGMVANTVATHACLANGETSVNYYWNKMYSANPEPFFRSFTDRYKYWVVDAFMANGHLYVILSKIGPQYGSPPGNIFNFSGLGFTLAKISNPQDVPSDWKTELLPLPEFISSKMEIRCHAKQDGYIYFFISRNDTSQSVVRKQIELIDNQERPFEYYALNKKWKQGIKPNDMYEISKGFRCNSVNFHPEIKQWVMINDIRFNDNKIKMHTSPSLTGPWSDEIVIYEIPEMTPGNNLYSKSNFCYLAREHIQYYDTKNHVMLLTYDINNTDYSEILSNPKIYTPKIIRVSLNNN